MGRYKAISDNDLPKVWKRDGKNCDWRYSAHKMTAAPVLNPQLEEIKREMQRLEELQSVHQLVNHPGWKHVRDGIWGEVEIAHEDMVGNISNDPVTYMRLQIRWQQRMAMARAIDDYVKTCETERANILTEGAHESHDESIRSEEDR